MDDEAKLEAYAIHRTDQALAMLRDQHPDKSEEWRVVLLQRLYHYMLNDGDLTGAPELPDE